MFTFKTLEKEIHKKFFTTHKGRKWKAWLLEDSENEEEEELSEKEEEYMRYFEKDYDAFKKRYLHRKLV